MMRTKQKLCGQKFGKLIVIDRTEDRVLDSGYKMPVWRCECECGKAIDVGGYYLINETTNSCGCLRQEKIDNGTYKKDRLPLNIVAAKDVYYSNYCDGNLSFDQFFDLSQQNCFYCGIEPSNRRQIRKKKASEFVRQNAIFIYNGLDKIDSHRNHDFDNVRSCCYICNRAKMDRTGSDFFDYISIIIQVVRPSIDEYRNLSLDIEVRDLNATYFKSSFNDKFRKYRDGDLSVEQFYQLTQLSCYYCGYPPFHRCNTSKNIVGEFIYSCLDRIDSSIGHFYTNVIPSCKYCNFAKSDLSITEFLEWIDRLKKNFNNLSVKAV